MLFILLVRSKRRTYYETLLPSICKVGWIPFNQRMINAPFLIQKSFGKGMVGEEKGIPEERKLYFPPFVSLSGKERKGKQTAITRLFLERTKTIIMSNDHKL